MQESIGEALDVIKKYERINESNQADFQGYISFIAGFARAVTPNQAEREAFTRRLLFWLGFERDDYALTDEDVVVNNWDNVKGALDNYRKRFAERAARATVPAAA